MKKASPAGRARLAVSDRTSHTRLLGVRRTPDADHVPAVQFSVRRVHHTHIKYRVRVHTHTPDADHVPAVQFWAQNAHFRFNQHVVKRNSKANAFYNSYYTTVIKRQPRRSYQCRNGRNRPTKVTYGELITHTANSGGLVPVI